jgi:hypothetical protein
MSAGSLAKLTPTAVFELEHLGEMTAQLMGAEHDRSERSRDACTDVSQTLDGFSLLWQRHPGADD